MTPPRRACSGCGALTADGYLCAACRPPRRCLDCHEPIVGRSRNATTCLACAAYRVTHRKGGQRRTACSRCQQPITGRGPRAIYCTPCAAYMSRKSCADAQALARRPWTASNPVRDLALEAQIEAEVQRLRRAGCYRITEEMIWARPVDWLAQQAPDTADLPGDLQRSAESRARNEKWAADHPKGGA